MSSMNQKKDYAMKKIEQKSTQNQVTVLNQIIKIDIKDMSRCHFPHQNRTIILDFPSLSHINSTMLLIETNKNLSFSSQLSLSCFEKPLQQNEAIWEQDSLGLLIEDQSQRQTYSTSKKKKYSKGGCTCKKTNCLKMYCQCFSTGKMCTPDCACYGCYNQQVHAEQIEVAKDQLKLKGSSTNRHTDRTCNCKKSQCQKKYCECFNVGVACSQSCNCSDCCNKENNEERAKHHREQNQDEESVSQ